MNDYWPKQWNKVLPSVLGEDFFSSFQEAFEKNEENEGNNETNASNNNNNNNNQKNITLQKNNEQVSSIMVNIYESNNEVLCIFRLPGLKLKDVDISIYGVTLEVNGKVYVEETGYRPIHQEIYEGPVHRKVTLPLPVRDDKIDASYNHGYLILRLHRLIQPGDKPKNIIIKDLENK